jgi:hypothetical protein
MTSVTYKDFDLTFGGTQAAPFISEDDQYIQVGGETWVKLKSINLQGTLQACGKSDLWTLMQEVRAGFNSDFGSLSADEYNVDCVKVISIEFQDTPMLSYVNYSISLEAYDQESFRQSYKVIDPTERVEFTENDDKTLNKIISISAKGVSCGSYDALDNAKAFVEGKFSEHESEKPALIDSNDANYNAHLLSSSEEIDRISGTYSKTKTYASDLDALNGALILRHTKEIFDERGEFSKIRFNGSIRYGIQNESASSQANAKLKTFIQSNKIDGYRLINLNVTEDKFAGVVNFSFEYTEDNTDVLDDWDVTISENSSSSLVQGSINGTITAKGPKECRWDKVIEYFGTNEEAKERYFGIVNDYYKKYDTVTKTASGQEVKLNEKPTDWQISKDEKNGEISYSFSFNDRISFGYYEFDYSMDFEPSVWQISANPTVDGDWAIIDLGFKSRSRFNINGNAIGDGDDIKLREFSEERYKHYCKGDNAKEWLENEQETKTKGADDDVGNAWAYEWSFLQKEAATLGPQGDEYKKPEKDGLLMN